MRHLPFVLAVLLSAHAPASVRLDFKSVQVANVVQMVYAETLRTSYVMDPELLADTRLISFRHEAKDGSPRPFLKELLAALGYEVRTRSGVDYISKRKVEGGGDIFVYRPKYRSASFLSEVLSPILQGRFTMKRVVSASEGALTPQDSSAAPGSAASMIDHESDLLVFSGQHDEVQRLRAALQEVDVPGGEVMVRGAVYEVSTTKSDGSAFGMLASLLQSRLSITVGALENLGTSLQIGSEKFDAIFSMLSQDGRFHVLSRPSLRIKSGSTGTFSVGEDVPTLGAVTYTSTGQPVQAVEYRSSGVIFEVRPIVRDEAIELRLDQQISSFAATRTGVNGSPTLSKRALSTSVSVRDSSLIVLGGLSEGKSSASREGLPFLPRALDSRRSSDSASEILLVLQVVRI